MRRPILLGASPACLALSAAFALRGRRSGRPRPPRAEILLVSGLHPNEACAPILAREVFRMLSQRGERVALYEVPYPYTLLALIDDPAIAMTGYSAPSGERRLDVDLDGLDESLARRHPGALVFEFHNSEDTQPMLRIEPGKPVQDYEVGPVGPGPHRPHEIGTWRNVGRDGRPGKCLIELPARYIPLDPTIRERRRGRLAQLLAEGREFDPRWSHYLETAADVEASRRRGYLDDALARKVADWIASRRDAAP